ncbi:GTP cyclohydrolase II-domain-containing protein [Powellomyces hirtus]|nr:GTP cyclohydrolase II-domain-containing protein [Powellomyces hirtus]
MVPHAPHLLAQLTEQGSPLILPSTTARTPSPFFADQQLQTPPPSLQQQPDRSNNNNNHTTLHSPSLNSRTDTPLSVRCQVRTRIPSEFGGICYLHLYTNTWDDEEHLALVYGDDVQSASLEEFRPGDTDRERMLRGVKGVAAPATPPPPAQPLTKTVHHVNGHHHHHHSQQNGHATDDDDDDEDPTSLSLSTPQPPLVRIHSCCFTGETLRSLRCDCAEQLEEAMRIMAKVNRGVVLYLKQEGRGIGLRDKLRAYNLIDLGHDTMAANLLLGHPPDARSYEIASAMLRDLGVDRVRLLTNNPDKMRHLQSDGVQVVERVPMIPASWRKFATEIAGVADGNDAAVAAIDHLTLSASSSPSTSPLPLPILSANGTTTKPSAVRPSSPANQLSTPAAPSSTSSRRAATPPRAHSPSPLSTSSITAVRLQDRDEYLVTKVQRMGHILDIPAQLLEAVHNNSLAAAAAHSASASSSPASTTPPTDIVSALPSPSEPNRK